MRNRRWVVRLSLACVVMTAISLGAAGTANALITNPPGYHHFWVLESGLCLMADADTGAVEGWRCLNAPSEEWQFITTSPLGDGSHYFLLYSNWTKLCMAVPSWPVNGTKVVQAPCDANDAAQNWTYSYVEYNLQRGSGYHIQSLQGGLCLDKPRGDNSQGVQMQTWTCAPYSTNPFIDIHGEQLWNYTPPA